MNETWSVRAVVSGQRVLRLLLVLMLAACGASDDGETAPGAAAKLSVSYQPVKTFHFSWRDVTDATHYRLLENPDGVSGFTPIGSDITTGTEYIDHVVPLFARTSAEYILQSCTDTHCVDSDGVPITGTLDESIGYIKANVTSDMEQARLDIRFGGAVCLSADGSTLAIGASGDASNATGIDGVQNDGSEPDSGAVYIFTKIGGSWAQTAYLKASNTGSADPDRRVDDGGDGFGAALSLNSDGTTLVVGAPGEDSSATGINGNQEDNGALQSGAAYVFTQDGNAWTQQAYIKASNTGVDPIIGADDWGDYFGGAVSLSADGNTLTVGAPGEDSSATGINGEQSDDRKELSGAVYVFERTGNTWTQGAYLKASNTDYNAWFGHSVALSGEGTTLAIGAPGEQSSAIGVNGDQFDRSAFRAGAVYLFVRDSAGWLQEAYIKSSNTRAAALFGGGFSAGGLDVSDDGNTLAVGAPGETSGASGINGDQNDTSADRAGAVYLFVRRDTQWQQQAYIKASNTDSADLFGTSVSLDGVGQVLAVGAIGEDSAATGLNGDQTDNSAIKFLDDPANNFAGAVYVFANDQGDWYQQAYVKASNTDALAWFGDALSLTADGATLAVGSPQLGAYASGGGDLHDGILYHAGSVYFY